MAGYRGWGVCLGAVDGDAKFQADLDDTVRVTALVQVGEPLGCVLAHLLMPVDAGRCQGEVQEVGCELVLRVGVHGAQAAVVGLGAGNDVLDVRFPDALEPGAGVGAVDAALAADHAGFD